MKTTTSPRSAARLALAIVAMGALASGTARAQETSAPPPEEPAQPAAEGPKDDTKEYRFELGLVGGGYFFTSEHGLGRSTESDPLLSPKSSFSLGLRLTINANKWFGFEGETIFIPTHTRDDQTSMVVAAYRGSFIFNIIPQGPFRPFILVGYGGLTTIPKDEEVVATDTDSAFHAGLGAKILFTDNFGLRLDGRVLAPPSFASDLGLKLGEETEFGGPDFEALLSLYVAFGEVEPLIKKEVVTVKAPPPPNPDPDGDGIVGKSDKCPEVAEDKDGFEDDDGCPEADNDGDGIPDAQDKCPNKAETKNGIDDEDGCPEEDTDGDGILGSRDKCPDQPETKNNYKDDDGCPDEVPPEVAKFTGVIQGINFKTNSAALLKNSYPLLNRAVKVLQDFPDVKLEISGHTDDRGKADFNRDLSQKRADAVKAYFVSKGIASDRLEAVGYGLDRPIASNKTKTGRSKNRRTEFKLITKN
jgi:OOP family OmpA-OmpF porin